MTLYHSLNILDLPHIPTRMTSDRD